MDILNLHSGNLFGGIETLLLALLEFQTRAPELRFSFALCFDGALRARLAEGRASSVLLAPVRFSRPWTVWRARRKLRHLLTQTRCDVALCHSPWGIALFGPVLKHSGIPLVYWQHDALSGTHWLERLAARYTPAQILANSHYSASTTNQVFPHNRAKLVRYPVHLRVPRLGMEERERVRAENGAGRGTVVIVQVSRMETWKGHALLLEAAARLPKRPPWKVWFVGGAQRPKERLYLESLRAQTQSLGLNEQVCFLGQRSDVPRLLVASDIHCQPNLGPEPFGITFVEALYAGLPVVTTNIGGGAEIVDETCGALVPPQDPGALARVLASLIADEPLRIRLGRAGPGRAAHLCDPVRQMQRLEQALRSVPPGC